MPSFNRKVGIQGRATVTATLALTVEKDVSVQVHGFNAAKQRLERAIAASTDPDATANDVYAALVEVCEWTAMLAKRKGLLGDVDACAVVFARNRHHHHSASTAEFVNGRRQWRAADALPSDPEHPGGKRRTWYERLAGKPLLEVFNRIAPKLT